MKKQVLATRAEIELRLERGLVGQIVTFPDIRDVIITGMVQRLGVEVSQNKELLINFQVDKTRYQFDLQYFVENITIVHGNSSGGETRNVRRILKGD